MPSLARRRDGPPTRVAPLVLDVTDAAQVQAAAHAASGATLVINNAGVLASFGVLDSSLEAIRRDVETNYFGLLNMATKPEEVARAILDGIAAGEEDIFPDPMAKDVGATFVRDPRAIEKKLAAMVPGAT